MQTISALTQAWYTAHIQLKTLSDFLALTKTERTIVDDKQLYSAQEIDLLISNKNKIDEQEMLVEEAKLKLHKIEEQIVKVLIAVGVQPNISTVAQVADKLGNGIRVNLYYDYDEVFNYVF